MKGIKATDSVKRSFEDAVSDTSKFVVSPQDASQHSATSQAVQTKTSQPLPYLPNCSAELFDAPSVSEEVVWRAVFEGAWPDAFFDSDEGLALLHENLVLRLSSDAAMSARTLKGPEFRRFLAAIAKMSGEVLRLNVLAREAGVTAETVKRWIAAAESAGIIFLLRAWPGETGRQLMKSPKLLMIDTGLIAALLGLRTPEDMAAHPCAMYFLETFALTAVMKSWSGAEKPHAFYYMKDSKGFSIDLLIETDDGLYPVNVQKGFAPGPRDWKSFATLARLSKMSIFEKPVKTGAVIGFTERPFAVDASIVVHGPEWIWERGAARFCREQASAVDERA